MTLTLIAWSVASFSTLVNVRVTLEQNVNATSSSISEQCQKSDELVQSVVDAIRREAAPS